MEGDELVGMLNYPIPLLKEEVKCGSRLGSTPLEFARKRGSIFNKPKARPAGRNNADRLMLSFGRSLIKD